MADADFSVKDVLKWARTKPADEGYRYGSNDNCALCQFLRGTGRAAHPTAGGISWTSWEKAPYVGRQIVNDAPIPEDLGGALHAGTFGGLVARLEKLCPETPVTRSDWLTIDAYLADIEQVAA